MAQPDAGRPSVQLRGSKKNNMTPEDPSPNNDIGFLSTVGLMMTYRCQVACPHCVVEAGPHRTEEVDLAEAKDWAEQIAGYRVTAV